MNPKNEVPETAHRAFGIQVIRLAAVITALVCLDPERAQAQVMVHPPGATLAGKTVEEWSTNWWRWGLSFAPPMDPFTDSSGQYANLGQSGPVFYLAGSPGGTKYRRFQVPTNTYVLVPLLVGEYSQLELGFDKSAAEIRQAAKQQADLIDSLYATVNGVPIPSATLFTHRVASPDFSFEAVYGNLLGVPGGNSGIAVADGYFLMLGPLPLGIHVLTYGGGSSALGIWISETDTISVGTPPVIAMQPTASQTVPEGQTITMAVEAAGSGPLSYRWHYNSRLVMTNGPGGMTFLGEPIASANSSSNTFTASLASSGYYWATVSNILGNVTSAAAYLDVRPNDLTIRSSGNGVILNWSYPGFALQTAPDPNGSYTNIPGAASPYTNANTRYQQFFRLFGN